MEFFTEGDKTTTRPAHDPAIPFSKYKGIFGNFPGGVEEINQWIAELRDDE